MKTIETLPEIHFTKRERQVILQICNEYSNSEIAFNLGIGIRTVEGHRANIMKKINARNTAGIIIFAVRHKMFKIR